MEEWVRTLPRGTEITNPMLKEQITAMKARPEFAEQIGKGGIPKYDTYQEWGKRNIAALRSNYAGFTFTAVMLGFAVRQLRAENADINNQNPWVLRDSEGNRFSVGMERYPIFCFYLTEGYFMYYHDGPNQGSFLEISEET